MKRWLLPLTIAAVVGLLWGSVAPAGACSCAPPPVFGWESEVAAHDVVVVGTIVQLVQDVEYTREYGGGDWDGVVRVERYLKGSGNSEFVVDDGRGGGDCGFIGPNDIGQRYLFFLGETDSGEFVTGICSGNSLLGSGWDNERLQEVQAITGPGELPIDTAARLDDVKQDFPWLPLALLGPLAFLAGAAFLWRRGEAHNG